MRTKSILLSAALMAAGVATSMAQSNVYSLNVVGYVNIPLAANANGQFTFFANPLDAGTNNTVDAIFGTNLPFNSTVYKFTGGGWNTVILYTSRGGWGDSLSPVSLAPGEGCFVLLPASSIGSPPTITCVGTVLQGTLTNNNIANGFTALASMIPVSGAIDSTGNGGLAFVPNDQDNVYEWDPIGQTWVTYLWTTRGAWGGNDPVVNPGQAFLLSTSAASPHWVQSFTVQ